MKKTITPVMIRTFAHLGQRGTFFGVALMDIARERKDVTVLTADVQQLSALNNFAETYKEQFLNVGIAEQNMIGVAAGLAAEGKCVFATTYAEFIALRSAEQVRHNLAYHQYNVKVVGGAAGVFSAKSGVSHWASEDIALMRSFPGMIVLSPADAFEAAKMAYAAAENPLPMYIRLSGGPSCPMVYKSDYDFEIGKAVLLKKGSDVALVATGLMVQECIKAEKFLSEVGLSCSVINMHTIKPLDTKMLDEIFEKHKLLVTVEEHNVVGGLGGAVAEYKAGLSHTPPQLFLGIHSFDGVGSQRNVWKAQGITAEQIAKTVKVWWDRL